MAAVFDLKAIFGGKPWYQSMTAWGLAIYVAGAALIDSVCGDTGLLSPGVCDTLTSSSDTIGVVLTALGLRRASNQ